MTTTSKLLTPPLQILSPRTNRAQKRGSFCACARVRIAEYWWCCTPTHRDQLYPSVRQFSLDLGSLEKLIDTMAGKNTDEYRKLVAVTPKLTKLLSQGNNVISLSQRLLTAGLISDSNNSQMTNQFVDAQIRAANLVSMVNTKVELNSQNFQIFVKTLQDEEKTYTEILAELCK